MEGGKWQRPPYRTPRVLRRAVAPAYAYKRGLPGAGYNANGHGARSAHGSCSASPRDRAVHGSDRTIRIRTVGANGIIIISDTLQSSVMQICSISFI
jgi:hypothetical protein